MCLCDFMCVVCVRQLRQFVATQSAGLRVRLHPSLQSEQIGCIPPMGVISFTSEVGRLCALPSSIMEE